jgi:gluconolactonase
MPAAQRALLLVALATHSVTAQATSFPTVGSIERLDPAIDALIPKNARIEKLADGFDWAEGPVWRAKDRSLVFSDVPKNVIYQWRDGSGLTVFMRPSGFTGPNPPGRELGSNGLTLDRTGAVIMADHGNRQIARVNEPLFTKTTIADRFESKRFNSPNDVIVRSNGDVYFTDPPFGLRGLDKDPAKELPYSGVFRATPAGDVKLLTSELAFPNGIAFSPDEKTLYVSNATLEQPIWMAYDVAADGTLSRGRTFFDGKHLLKRPERSSVPDGMRVDIHGNVFATGLGGVNVLSPTGKHLGTIVTGPVANCAFGDDGSTLYITAGNQLLRIRLTTNGVGF